MSSSYELYALCSAISKKSIWSQHQYYIEWVSSSMMLCHGVGTGKTRCAIRLIQKIRKRQPDGHIIICTKSAIISYWNDEFAIVGCPTDNISIMGLKRLCNMITSGNMPPNISAIIIDEAHKINNNQSYHILKKYYETISISPPNLLLLTATPSYNQPHDIAYLCNLLLVASRSSYLMLPENADEFAKIIGSSHMVDIWKSHISYVPPWNDGTIEHRKQNAIISFIPNGIQHKTYMRYASTISQTAQTSVPNAVKLRSICSFVYPNGTFGKVASQEYINYDNGFLSWKPEHIDAMKHIMHRDNIAAYSCKFAFVLRVLDRIVRGSASSWIRSNMYGKVYIYSETIYGILDDLALCLEANGYVQYGSGQNGISFAIVCGIHEICSPEQKEARLAAFQSGSCRILFGSEILRDGVYLNDVTDCIILVCLTFHITTYHIISYLLMLFF